MATRTCKSYLVAALSQHRSLPLVVCDIFEAASEAPRLVGESELTVVARSLLYESRELQG